MIRESFYHEKKNPIVSLTPYGIVFDPVLPPGLRTGCDKGKEGL
jgi:hypothetical protein